MALVNQHHFLSEQLTAELPDYLAVLTMRFMSVASSWLRFHVTKSVAEILIFLARVITSLLCP